MTLTFFGKATLIRMMLPLWEYKNPSLKRLSKQSWSLLNFKKQLSDFGETPIWYNSLISIDNKPVHYRNWSSAGIYFVSDLLEEDSQFLTFDTFREKFTIKAHFLQYHGMICAISNIKRKNHCPQIKVLKPTPKAYYPLKLSVN